jgi:hypothetical protein
VRDHKLVTCLDWARVNTALTPPGPSTPLRTSSYSLSGPVSTPSNSSAESKRAVAIPIAKKRVPLYTAPRPPSAALRVLRFGFWAHIHD